MPPKEPSPPVVKVDLTGMVVVVVGANTGLGFEAAKHLAGMNPARLILACRNPSKGQEALSSALFYPSDSLIMTRNISDMIPLLPPCYFRYPGSHEVR